MSLAKRSPTFLLPLLALAGCCGPAISGRYCDVAPPPGAATCGEAAGQAKGPCPPGGCGLLSGHGALLDGPWLTGWRGMNASGPVPAEQHADYVSPLPKFHPVPTRPVFEPLPAYGPPGLLDVVPDPSRGRAPRWP